MKLIKSTYMDDSNNEWEIEKKIFRNLKQKSFTYWEARCHKKSTVIYKDSKDELLEHLYNLSHQIIELV